MYARLASPLRSIVCACFPHGDISLSFQFDPVSISVGCLHPLRILSLLIHRTRPSKKASLRKRSKSECHAFGTDYRIHRHQRSPRAAAVLVSRCSLSASPRYLKYAVWKT